MAQLSNREGESEETNCQRKWWVPVSWSIPQMLSASQKQGAWLHVEITQWNMMALSWQSAEEKQIWLFLALKYVTARLINLCSPPFFLKMPWEIGNVDYQTLCCCLLLINFYYDSAYSAGHNTITFTQPNCFHLGVLCWHPGEKPSSTMLFLIGPDRTPQRLRMSHKQIPSRCKCLGKQANVKRNIILTHIYTLL